MLSISLSFSFSLCLPPQAAAHFNADDGGGGGEIRQSVRSLASDDPLQVQGLASNRLTARLRAEVMAEVQAARDFIDELLTRFPEIARAIQTRKAARLLLAEERSAISHLAEEGLIDETEEVVLLEENNVSIKKLESHPTSLAVPSKAQRIRQHDLFKALSPAAANALAAVASELYFNPGTSLLQQGSTATRWMLPVAGAFRVAIKPTLTDSVHAGLLDLNRTEGTFHATNAVAAPLRADAVAARARLAGHGRSTSTNSAKIERSARFNVGDELDAKHEKHRGLAHAPLGLEDALRAKTSSYSVFSVGYSHVLSFDGSATAGLMREHPSLRDAVDRFLAASLLLRSPPNAVRLPPHIHTSISGAGGAGDRRVVSTDAAPQLTPKPISHLGPHAAGLSAAAVRLLAASVLPEPPHGGTVLRGVGTLVRVAWEEKERRGTIFSPMASATALGEVPVELPEAMTRAAGDSEAACIVVVAGNLILPDNSSVAALSSPALGVDPLDNRVAFPIVAVAARDKLRVALGTVLLVVSEAELVYFAEVAGQAARGIGISEHGRRRSFSSAEAKSSAVPAAPAAAVAAPAAPAAAAAVVPAAAAAAAPLAVAAKEAFAPPGVPTAASPAPVLPAGWTQHLEVASGRPYYVQAASGTTQWEAPDFDGGSNLL